MSKTLYVTDLDGTLLNRQDRINPESIAIINELVARGMLFTYATARSLVSASVVTEGLTTDFPVIIYNGAFIIHPSTSDILSEKSFTIEERQRVIEVLDEYDISPLGYSYVDEVERVSWIVSRVNDGMRRYINNRKGTDPRFRPIQTKEELYQGEMFYYTCIGEREELQSAYDLLSKDTRFCCTLQQELYRPEYWFEIMPAQATKAEAIGQLKKLWNCDRVVSFGDAINDIPMFEISDECYAVENAVDELKAIATGIIDSNENDGVAKWLQEHVMCS